MKSVNPLLILLLSVVIFVSSFFALQASKEELNKSFNSYSDVKKLSQSYKNLKIKWNDKKVIDKTINRIIDSVRIKDIDVSKNSKIITIKIKSESLQKIDRFVNKMLNSNLNIKKLKIQKNSLDVQIGYR